METKCFEQYRIVSGLTTSTKEQQVGTLLYCIGEAAESVFTSTNAAEEQKKYDTVIEKFNIFFKVRRNVIYEHARFNCRNQQQGETTEQYTTELYHFAENCEYGTLKDEMIRDCLRSCRHMKHVLLQQPQLEANLTLDEAKQKFDTAKPWMSSYGSSK